MSVRSEILSLLEKNKGSFLSGEEMAARLGVTRASVWKAVRALEEEGVRIEAVRKKGYRLPLGDDRLSEEGIRACLDGEDGFDVTVFQEIDSTNLYARRLLAEHGADLSERFLIAADRQGKGRGRLGKSFFSPSGCGLYMSFVQRRRLRPEEALYITMAAAVAVEQVIREHSEEDPAIKWVNDIWIGDRKVCGILTEAVSDLETGMIEAVVIGIGLNVREPENGYPADIAQIARGVDTFRVSRNLIAAEIGKKLFRLLEDPAGDEVFASYRARSLVIGKEIGWIEDGRERTGRVRDMNRQGNLIVDTPEGEAVLRAGEISVRPAKERG